MKPNKQYRKWLRARRVGLFYRWLVRSLIGAHTMASLGAVAVFGIDYYGTFQLPWWKWLALSVAVIALAMFFIDLLLQVQSAKVARLEKEVVDQYAH